MAMTTNSSINVNPSAFAVGGQLLSLFIGRFGRRVHFTDSEVQARSLDGSRLFSRSKALKWLRFGDLRHDISIHPFPASGHGVDREWTWGVLLIQPCTRPGGCFESSCWSSLRWPATGACPAFYSILHLPSSILRDAFPFHSLRAASCMSCPHARCYAGSRAETLRKMEQGISEKLKLPFIRLNRSSEGLERPRS